MLDRYKVRGRNSHAGFGFISFCLTKSSELFCLFIQDEQLLLSTHTVVDVYYAEEERMLSLFFISKRPGVESIFLFESRCDKIYACAKLTAITKTVYAMFSVMLPVYSILYLSKCITPVH